MIYWANFTILNSIYHGQGTHIKEIEVLTNHYTQLYFFSKLLVIVKWVEGPVCNVMASGSATLWYLHPLQQNTTNLFLGLQPI